MMYKEIQNRGSQLGPREVFKKDLKNIGKEFCRGNPLPNILR